MSFRDRLDIEQLLKSLDIKYERKGVTLRGLCPSPDHTDQNPSWGIVDAPGSDKHGGHGCFSCGFGGGPWELVQAVRGVDEETACEYVTALITGKPRVFDGVPKVVIKRSCTAVQPFPLSAFVRFPGLENSTWPEVFWNYLTQRGVTQAQMNLWRMGYATKGPLAWRIVIPVHTRGRLVAHVGRNIFQDGRKRYDMPYGTIPGAEPDLALLGEPLLDPALDTLTIAEGSFSMLALERAGAPNPIALLGSNWSPARAAILTVIPWRRVVIATDPDAAGDRVAARISASFRKAKIRRVRLDRSPDDCESDVLRTAVAAALS